MSDSSKTLSDQDRRLLTRTYEACHGREEWPIFSDLQLKEVQCVAVLRWLLDADSSHGLGDAFANAFLKDLSIEPTPLPRVKTEVPFSYTVGQNRRADLVCYDHEGLVVLALEAKTATTDHSGQIGDYQEKFLPPATLVYLTPQAVAPGDENYESGRWSLRSWHSVAEVLQGVRLNQERNKGILSLDILFAERLFRSLSQYSDAEIMALLRFAARWADPEFRQGLLSLERRRHAWASDARLNCACKFKSGPATLRERLFTAWAGSSIWSLRWDAVELGLCEEHQKGGKPDISDPSAYDLSNTEVIARDLVDCMHLWAVRRRLTDLWSGPLWNTIKSNLPGGTEVAKDDQAVTFNQKGRRHYRVLTGTNGHCLFICTSSLEKVEDQGFDDWDLLPNTGILDGNDHATDFHLQPPPTAIGLSLRTYARQLIGATLCPEHPLSSGKEPTHRRF